MFAEPDELVAMMFDPGTNTFGVTIAGINPVNLDITWIKVNTYTGEKILRGFYPSAGSSHRALRLQGLRRVLSGLIEAHLPNFFGWEDSFYGNATPDAFRALVETVCMIESVVHESGSGKHIIRMSPRAVKKAVAVENIKDKNSVKIALSKIPEIWDKVKDTAETLDEHGIDSLAAFYAFYIHFLLGVRDADQSVMLK